MTTNYAYRLAVVLFCVVVVLCAHAIVADATRPRASRPIIIDTDANNDDVMAIVFALKHPSIDVKAVSVVGTGWAHLAPGVTNMYGLLSFMGRNDIPVAAGAALAAYETESGEHGCTYAKVVPEDGGRSGADTVLGTAKWFPQPPLHRQYSPQSPKAEDVLAQVINSTRGTIDILALGPLTNIDILFIKHPWTKAKIGRIYIMGGAVNVPGNIWWNTPNNYAEYNIYGDPDAAKRVFASGVPITLVPLDASDTLPMTEDFYDRVVGITFTREAKYIAALMEATKASAPNFFTGFYIWDPLTTAILANEGLYAATTADVNLTVVTHLDNSPGEIGRTKIDDQNGHPAHVITSVNKLYYNDFVIYMNLPKNKAPAPRCFCPDIMDD